MSFASQPASAWRHAATSPLLLRMRADSERTFNPETWTLTKWPPLACIGWHQAKQQGEWIWQRPFPPRHVSTVSTLREKKTHLCCRELCTNSVFMSKNCQWIFATITGQHCILYAREEATYCWSWLKPEAWLQAWEKGACEEELRVLLQVVSPHVQCGWHCGAAGWFITRVRVVSEACARFRHVPTVCFSCLSLSYLLHKYDDNTDFWRFINKCSY